MAAAAIVYILDVLAGGSPTNGTDMNSIGSYPTKEACDAAQATLAAQMKDGHADKFVVCVSSKDITDFAMKIATPYMK